MTKNNPYLDKLMLAAILTITAGAIATYIGLSSATVHRIVDLGVVFIVSAAVSVAGSIVLESIGGDFLKKISLTFKVGPLPFSVTLFTVAVFIFKLFILR